MKPPAKGTALYLDSLGAVSAVVAVNLGIAFAIFYGKPITRQAVMIDAASCGAITSLLCVFYVFYAVRQKRKQGLLPRGEAADAAMQRLPAQPLRLGLWLALFCSLLLPLVARLSLWLFPIAGGPFHRFAVWKAVYSSVLVVKLTEWSVLRYLQPDCRRPGDPPQRGEQAVKNPLTQARMLTDLFNTVTMDLGVKLLLGLGRGTVRLAAQTVVILPTRRSALAFSAAGLGLTAALRMVYPMAKSLRELRASGQLPPLEKRNPFLARLPLGPIRLALLYAPVLTAFTAAVFYATFAFFELEAMHFFQFFILRAGYLWLITQPTARLLAARYRQPERTPRSREGGAVPQPAR